MMTAGVSELPDCVKAKALELVAKFDQFSEDNDPHAEHDFGSFELVNRVFLWKIDYYDPQWEFGSEDPSDPERTIRAHAHARKRVLASLMGDFPSNVRLAL
jgi:hypothetical protein